MSTKGREQLRVSERLTLAALVVGVNAFLRATELFSRMPYRQSP